MDNAKLMIIIDCCLDTIEYELKKIKNEFIEGTRDCGSFATQDAYLKGRLDSLRHIIDLIDKEVSDE